MGLSRTWVLTRHEFCVIVMDTGIILVSDNEEGDKVNEDKTSLLYYKQLVACDAALWAAKDDEDATAYHLKAFDKLVTEIKEDPSDILRLLVGAEIQEFDGTLVFLGFADQTTISIETYKGSPGLHLSFGQREVPVTVN